MKSIVSENTLKEKQTTKSQYNAHYNYYIEGSKTLTPLRKKIYFYQKTHLLEFTVELGLAYLKKSEFLLPPNPNTYRSFDVL